MGRLFAVCLVMLGVAFAHASDALILIQHDRAGPNLRTGAFIYPQWLLWPSEGEHGSENGLLSIATGLDWQGERADLSFSSGERLSWRSRNYRSLSKRGYLKARTLGLSGEDVTLVANRSGAVGQEALLLAVGAARSIVQARPFKAPLPKKGLVLYEALSWDDVRSIAGRCGGRALAVEFPPASGTQWTRFWRFGSGWPSKDLVPEDRKLAVPGLVPIGEALELLLRPGRFIWVPDSSHQWGGANRWLDRGARTSPAIAGGLYAFAVLTALIGLIRTASEQTSRLDRLMVQAVLISVAADVLAGALASSTGLSAWPVLFGCSEIALLGLGAGISALIRIRHPHVHVLFGLCLVGAVVISLCNPVWSDFSPVFRLPQLRVSPEAAAAWIGYLSGTFAFASDLGRRWLWVRRGAGLALVAQSCFFDPWWIGGQASNVAIAAIPLAAAEGVCNGVFIVTLALLPTSLAGVLNGISWRPSGLIHNASEAQSFNAAEWARFMISPGLIGSLMLAAAIGMFGTGFTAYRVRRLVRENPRRMCLLSASTALAAFGLFQPEMLPGAIVLILGGALVVVHDAVA